jgi:predicted AlkP superfamily phosphohydrolase/phosphomutase/tetratricopeptide (TPR) repeat protein
LDTVDWDQLGPLIERGHLPNFASLIEDGVIADLASLQPPIPPLLWTSLATGVRADRHGVLDHLASDAVSGELLPVSSSHRKVKTIWQLLTDAGLICHAINWYGSHPAEALSGIEVSDRFAAVSVDTPEQVWPLVAGAVFPQELEDDLGRVRCHPAVFGPDDLAPYIRDLPAIDQRLDRRPLEIAEILAQSASIHAATRWILEHQPWHFLAVRFHGIGVMNRRFMACQSPRLNGVSEADEYHYGGVIAAGLRLHDAMLGQLLALAGPRSTVIVVSEQGFRSGPMRPPQVQALPQGISLPWQRRQGLFAMAGPLLRRDAVLAGVSLLDLAPTVLRLFDRSPSPEMAGVLIREAFLDSPPDLQAPLSAPVIEPEPSEAAVRSEQAPQAESIFNHEAIDQLLALGFPLFSEEEARDHQQHQLRSEYALAQVHIEAGRWPAALSILEALVDHPLVQPELRLLLAFSQLRCGQFSQAQREAEVASRQGASACLSFVIRALVAVARHRPIDALKLLEQAEQQSSATPFAQGRLGLAWIQLGRLGPAERHLRSALSADPDDTSLRLALAAVLMDRRQHTEALAHTQLAVMQQPRIAGAHALLGLALWSCGEMAAARTAFAAALERQPQPVLRLQIEGMLASLEELRP